MGFSNKKGKAKTKQNENYKKNCSVVCSVILL
jgi:hypothetical protein